MRKLLGVVLRATLMLALFLPWAAIPASAAFSCAPVTEITPPECEALVALYNSTGGPQWNNQANWLVTNTPSNWYGLWVGDGHVRGIYLDGNNLQGAIPTAIGGLTELWDFSIAGNPLAYPLPPELYTLTNLKWLYIGGNNFTGPLPPALATMPNLEGISAWGNAFTGPFPAALWSNTRLVEINFAGSALTGTLPSSIAHLTNLEVLDFISNQFTGSIPSDIGSLSKLWKLDLGNNQLTGTLPSSLGSLSQVKILNLSGNQFSGAIPASVSNLTQLEALAISSAGLTGGIPAGVWSLPNLRFIYLGNNQLTGSIPSVITATNLDTIDLAGNQLSGALPAALGTLTNLRVLNLRGNQFSGAIPSSLGSLAQLTGLWLDANQFSGPIPHELGNLSNLQSLSLSLNELTGPVPAELALLTGLYGPGAGPWGDDGLSLDYNKLTVPDPYPSAPPTALESFLLAKDPDWHLHQAKSSVLGSSGGSITAADESVVFVVPAGTVPEATTLEYQPQPWPSQSTGNLAFANHSFALHALDEQGDPLPSFTFAQPVTLTLEYADADVAGIFESSLIVYYWDDTAQEWIDATTTCPAPNNPVRSLANNTITINICHLSEFSLLGKVEHQLFIPLTRR